MAKAASEVVGRRIVPGAALLPLVGALAWMVALVLVGGGEMLRWSVSAALGALWPLVAGAALALLPGWAVLELLWPDDTAAWPERLSLAWCVGVALPPMLIELTTVVGLRWNAAATAVYVVASASVLGWLAYRNHGRERAARAVADSWHGLLLLGIVLTALVVRLFIVRDLPVGMWGDSYHHTMIAQLLVDNGRLFSSWQPYAPLTTFTYHYGFHANAAFFSWLSGVPVTRSVVIVGQLLNTAAAVGAYTLGARWSGSRTAGLWAAALTAFVNLQPTFYVNWGRYTQLSGQVILVAVLVCWLGLLEAPRWSWRRVGLAALVTAGLMQTHYIVTIFAAVFLAAYVLVLALRVRTWRALLQLLGRAAATSGLALLLAAPWLLKTLGGYLGRNLGGMVSGSVGADRIAAISNLLPIAPTYVKAPLLMLAFAGLCVTISRRDWRTALFAVWSALLILTAIPFVVGLPGTGVVETFTAYIGLYFPVIPLAAYALAAAQGLMARWHAAGSAALASCAIVALSLWGVSWQQRLLDPTFQLFTPADAAAMQWIRAATPPDASFVVNMFPAYGDTVVVGSDGGWWIPLLTQRKTTLPPITYGSERGPDDGYSRRVNDFAAALREHPLPADEGLALLREHGIRYVYTGAHVGQAQPIDVAALRKSPAFRVAYDRDGVTIFELAQP